MGHLLFRKTIINKKETIDISWVLDFTKNIPDILIYIVPGYLFLFVYRYIRSRNENDSSQTTHLLLISMIASLILKTVYDVIIYRFLNLSWAGSSRRYLLGIFLFSVFIGYVMDIVVSSKKTSSIQEKLGIIRTQNDNIWRDIIKPNIWVRVWIKSGKSYYGQIKFVEDFKREPLIALENYQVLDDDANVIIDNTSDNSRSVLLNLSQFDRVEIVEQVKQEDKKKNAQKEN